MKKNIGITDRIVRVVIGLCALVGGFLIGSWWGIAGGVLLAAFCFFQAATSWCVVYSLFGISTCPVELPPQKSS